jgi:hypothetical protein
MRRKWFLVACLALGAGLTVTSCGKKEPPKLSPMSASEAPTWDGKQPVGEFIVGKWSESMGLDPATAKEFGLEEGEDVDGMFYWEFKSDGTFIYTKAESPDKVHGTWTPAFKGVTLNYERWNDEKLNDFAQRMRTEAETGASAAITREMAVDDTIKMLRDRTYIEVAEDKKGLVFTSPTKPEPGSVGGMFDMDFDTPLVRMK